jgi:hypothetical protein
VDGAVQLPAGIPALIQLEKLEIWADVARLNGAGGMGELELWIRSSASAPLDFEGCEYAGAFSAARVSRRFGAPFVGSGP